jgi:hypothetical protein
MTSGDMSFERHPVSSDIGLQEVSSQVCVTKHKGRPPGYRMAPSGCAWLFRALPDGCQSGSPCIWPLHAVSLATTEQDHRSQIACGSPTHRTGGQSATVMLPRAAEVGFHGHKRAAVTSDRTPLLLVTAATQEAVTQLAYQPRTTAQVRDEVP